MNYELWTMIYDLWTMNYNDPYLFSSSTLSIQLIEELS